MDNNDSKPQQTGGLKLMTVFIAVLALHVLVIGGFTVYHLMGSGGSDADTALDKTHKLKADGTAVADAPAPDAANPDKATDATAATDGAAAPATTGTTTASSSTGTDTAGTSTATTTASAVAPVSTATATPASTQVAANPAAAPVENGSPNTPILVSADDMSQTSTIPAMPTIPAALIPPPDATPAPNTPAVAPVLNPPASATEVVVKTPAPAVVHPPAPVKAETPKPASAIVSTGTASVPAISATTVANATDHARATPRQLAPTIVGDTSDEKTPAVAHDEHSAAPLHEAKKVMYTVKITDSFQKIAKAHHVTVAELKAANHIKGNTLHTGQKLVIPESKTEVAKNEKLHDSSTGKTASMASVTAAPASRAKNHHQYYTVAKGDTLRKIAKKYDVTSSALEKANGLSGTKVTVGEKLRIPTHDVRSADTATRVVAAPAAEPTTVQPSQVQTQPAAVVQPEPTPMATPEPVPQPTPAPVSNPELANLTF